MTSMTMPPSGTETAELAAYETLYARDSLGFVRWLAGAELDHTQEMAIAIAVLEGNKQP